MTPNNLKPCIVIPARYKSSRFPGKPLVLIKGIPMIIRVCMIAEEAIGKSNVYVATDDIRIARKVDEFGYQYLMTSPNALTGTDRVAEASKYLDYDIYINLQGDEPLVSKKDLIKCIKLKMENPELVFNGYTKIESNENYKSKNIPKVVFNEDNILLYISRSEIPGTKNNSEKNIFFKQVCIYGFNSYELNLFLDYGRKSLLESKEDIEILRFLEMDVKIKMFSCQKTSCAVDVPEDVKNIEKILDKKLL
tara:strand:+ start:2325 stop:3074 length:750 start_codon:yes stop_codon:yes gene_type:complete